MCEIISLYTCVLTFVPALMHASINAYIPGSSLNVLGKHVHSYVSTAEDCFAMCAAASDCGGFVDELTRKACLFKRADGKVRPPPASQTFSRAPHPQFCATGTQTAPKLP